VPVYQYFDEEKRRIVEFVRPIAERDCVPAGLKRIPIPQRIAICGTSSSPIDPTSADSQVPKAFRDLEQKIPAREIVKESGFSIEKVKEVWGM